MHVTEDPAEAREAVRALQRAGKRVGLVPTMGALHAGHLSLVTASREVADATAATIFVNPTQFGPQEDFARYPRTLEADLEKLREAGTDLVFVPNRETMYPPGYSTYVEPPEIANPFEGALRPGHFRGVATVVLKLFQIIPADDAFFGQKDYQQTLVIRRMVEDFNLPIAIHVCETIRESDGLAMSSRNAYLSADERRRATGLYRALETGARMLKAGERQRAGVVAAMTDELHQSGIDAIDYVAVAHPETLAEPEQIELPVVLLIAARVGTTRLIDNRLVS